MKTAILYRAHKDNPALRKEFTRLQNECQSCDVYLVYDQTQFPIEEDGIVNFFPFTQDEMSKLGYQFKDMMMNCDYPALHFYKKYPNYGYYWLIDYDVRFNGNWNDLISYYEDCVDYDLIGTYVFKPDENPLWKHWEKANMQFPQNKKFSAFYSVIRFTNKALSILDQEYSSGAFGFVEYISPTLLSMHGCKMATMYKKGRFKIPDKEKFFCDYNTFRYRPVLEEVGDLKNMLYHPVKGEDC